MLTIEEHFLELNNFIWKNVMLNMEKYILELNNFLRENVMLIF